MVGHGDDMKKPNTLIRRLGLVLLPVALLAAGWYLLALRGGDLAQIAQQVEAGEPAAAVIELKSYLQAQPDSAPARALLGRALLRTGDANGAVAEFERALGAGMGLDEVAAPLSSALESLGRHQDLVARLAGVMPSSKEAAAELLSNLALAHASLGDADRSQLALDGALAQVPGFPAAVLLQARQMAGHGNVAGALAAVDRVIAGAPATASAWITKGDLLRTRPDAQKESLAAYRRAVELAPSQAAGHAALVGQLIRGGDLAAARQQWQHMSKASPGNGLTQYFDALLALREGDAARARDALQRVIRAGGNSAAVFVMAGQADSMLGLMAQAETHFSKAVALAPSAAEPRQQWAAVLLRQGQAARAVDVLRPLVGPGSQDAVALALVAQAHLALGDFAKADAQFDRATKLAPGDIGLKTAKAQAALGMGRAEIGLGALETLAASDKGQMADLALISARLNRRELDLATKAVEAMGSKQPKSALVDELRGQIALLRNDRTLARTSFEQALRKEPARASAVNHLARLDIADHQPKAARDRYEALLKLDPQNLGAWLGLAELLRQDPADAKGLSDLLDRAVAANPVSPVLRLAVVDHWARLGDQDAALTAARAAAAALPNDLGIQERLAVAQLAAGDRHQGLATLRKVASAQPGSADVQLRLAAALAAAGETAQADERVQAAMRAEPDLAAVQLASVAMALRQGQPAKALAAARAMQARLPAQAVGFSAAGDVEASQGHWEAAAAAYAQALTRTGAHNAAAAYHNSLVQARKEGEARRFETDWQKSHPKDLAYRLYLAERASKANDFAAAEAHLRFVAQANPSHAGALNNLANLLLRQHKPGAQQLAERAVALAPQVAAFRDTLAAVLSSGNQLDKAIDVQASAVKLSPGSRALRMNLAKLYLRQGDQARARDELTRLAQPGDQQPADPEANALLAQLGPGTTDAAGPVGAQRTAPSSSLLGGRIDRSLALWLGLLALAVAGLLVVAKAAVAPPLSRVVRSVRLSAPMGQVFDALWDFRRWESWSPWAPFTVAFARQFSGAATGQGHRCEWVNEGGRQRGSAEIMHQHIPDQLVIEWKRDARGDASQRHELMLTAPDAGTTLLQWTVVTPAPFMARLGAVLSNRPWRQGRQLATAMDRLRNVVEADARRDLAWQDPTRGEFAMAA